MPFSACFFSLAAFKFEWRSDNAYRQYPELLGRPGDDRGSTCSCSPTHPSRNENHLGVGFQQLLYLFKALLRRSGANFGVGSGTESFCKRKAQLYLVLNGTGIECLSICIADHEIHSFDAFFEHMVHGIASASTNTDHFDGGILVFGHIEIHRRIIFVCHYSFLYSCRSSPHRRQYPGPP